VKVITHFAKGKVQLAKLVGKKFNLVLNNRSIEASVYTENDIDFGVISQLCDNCIREIYFSLDGPLYLRRTKEWSSFKLPKDFMISTALYHGGKNPYCLKERVDSGYTVRKNSLANASKV